MKRLREEEATPGSLEAAAIDLLRAEPPLEVSPLARARVRVALTRGSASRAGWMLRPVVVLMFLLVGATVAGAAFGVRMLAARRPLIVPIAAPAAPRAPIAPVVIEEPPVADVAPSSPPTPSRARAPHHVAARSAPPVSPTEAPAPVVASDDPTLVATALRALRREHDPARAGALVEDYLRQWPSGALTEEAMALAVEAAAARHDARAGAWAERYLRRFPNGRFREAVARSAPGARP